MDLRKIIFWGHLITGITVGSVILVMAVTGILIAFEPQIEELSERKVRYVEAPADGTVRLGAGEIVAKAGMLRPGIKSTGLSQSAVPTASVTVYFGREGNVFVNPYTGEVLGGISKLHELMHKLIEIHRWLGSKEIGKPVANACNAALLIMILSGLYLWLPQQWNAAVRKAIFFFNPELTGKARDWNWHNVIGVWCAPFLLITTLTGLVMAYAWANQLLFRLTGSEVPAAAAPAKPGTPAEEADFDKLWASAAAQVQNWQSISIRLPREAGAPATAYIIEAGAKPFMRSQLSLRPSTGEVVKWEPFAGQSLGKKSRAWIVPLHTGQAWGIPGQLLMMTSALGAAVLVWTGVSLAWRRFFPAKVPA